MCRECVEDGSPRVECPEHRLELLRSVYLFADLGTEAMAEVAACAKDSEFLDDRWLCLHGQPASSFFLVLDGQVGLLRETEEGEELIVTIVGRGELFGEDLAVLDDPVHPLSARALGAVRVAEFDLRRFRALLDREPLLLRKLLQTAHRRNVILLEELEAASVRSASDRLLTFLERHAGSDLLRIPKNVLASRLAMRPETLSRVLARLKACDRLREVDGCLQPLGPGGEAAERCAGCPVFWGRPDPAHSSHGSLRANGSATTRTANRSPWAAQNRDAAAMNGRSASPGSATQSSRTHTGMPS